MFVFIKINRSFFPFTLVMLNMPSLYPLFHIHATGSWGLVNKMYSLPVQRAKSCSNLVFGEDVFAVRESRTVELAAWLPKGMQKNMVLGR